jgi:hypothetical protein
LRNRFLFVHDSRKPPVFTPEIMQTTGRLLRSLFAAKAVPVLPAHV